MWQMATHEATHKMGPSGASERRSRLRLVDATDMVGTVPEMTDTTTISETHNADAAAAVTQRAWTDDDVCTYLAISRATLRRLVGEPGFPEPRRIGAQRRWAPESVPQWLAEPELERLELDASVGPRGVATRVTKHR